MSTGLGRATPSVADSVPLTTTNRAPNHTIRCRQRFATTTPASPIHHNACRPRELAGCPSTFITSVNHGVRTSARPFSSQWSRRSSPDLAPEASPVTATNTKAPTARTSHQRPEPRNCLGRGGGSPEGRRRRAPWDRFRRTAADAVVVGAVEATEGGDGPSLMEGAAGGGTRAGISPPSTRAKNFHIIGLPSVMLVPATGHSSFGLARGSCRDRKAAGRARSGARRVLAQRCVWHQSSAPGSVVDQPVGGRRSGAAVSACAHAASIRGAGPWEPGSALTVAPAAAISPNGSDARRCWKRSMSAPNYLARLRSCSRSVAKSLVGGPETESRLAENATRRFLTSPVPVSFRSGPRRQLWTPGTPHAWNATVGGAPHG